MNESKLALCFTFEVIVKMILCDKTIRLFVLAKHKTMYKIKLQKKEADLKDYKWGVKMYI